MQVAFAGASAQIGFTERIINIKRKIEFILLYTVKPVNFSLQ
ncbi:hypothetical protein M153_5730004766 [Pseudoloma neurophilia]|uniref:Uncharacterized protein n=1 Tax=Pseudoloma neurophilia TaxID=146866 RepID=A0A0R0LWS3_9MICR|nr:hypothetical protein M153_5730004766 [Pseudoloma neurophilia]